METDGCMEVTHQESCRRFWMEPISCRAVLGGVVWPWVVCDLLDLGILCALPLLWELELRFPQFVPSIKWIRDVYLASLP